MTYEELHPSHFVAWGSDVMPRPEAMTGFAARNDDGELVAICCFYAHEGRWWAGFDRKPHCSPRVHAQAVRSLDALRRAKVPEVWAIPDPDVPRAEAWMKRLGFEPVSDGEWRLWLS